MGFPNDGGSITKVYGGYFTTHLGFDPVNAHTTLVAYFNESGQMQWDSTLSSNTETFSQSNWNTNIIDTGSDEEKWIIGNYNPQGMDDKVPFLQKFNINGTLLELVILDTLVIQRPDTWGGFKNGLGLFLLCRDNTLNGEDELLLVSCGLNGQYQWHHTFDTGLSFSPKCIVDVGDGFIVGGWRYATLTDQGNNDGQQYIRKFNYAGVSQWISTLTFDDNPNLGAVGIVKLENGNYLFAGTKFIENVSIQPLIGELDAATGDTLWTKLYFDGAPDDENDLENFNSINRIHGFKKLSDGGYLGVGECRHEIIPDSAFGPLDNAAFLMKLDSEYNLLWKRVYVPEGYAGLDASPAQCQLNDFVENDDGSITALGRVYMFTGAGPKGGYIQDSYLIRVDSLGCLLSGCEVGITEFEPSLDVSVYPNPTSGSFNILFPSIDKWQVALFDMKGSLMKSFSSNQTKEFTIDSNAFCSGVYLVRCTNESKIFTNKLIINH